MIQVYQTNKRNSFIEEISSEITGGMDLNNKWIHLTNPTDREIELVSRSTGVEEDMLKAALDEEERPRIDIEDGNSLTLFDIPTIEVEENYYTYSTMPLGFVVTKSCVVTVCLKETSIINTFSSGRAKGFSTFKRSRFLYKLIYNTHIKYLQYLRQIDKASSRIQNELKKSTKDKELIQLLDLEKSLVYFSTSLKGNNLVITKLKRFDHIQRYDDDMDLLDDVEIENKQAQEMCNIYRDILTGTTQAYASLISNKLNNVMKLLTSLTVILAIPTLIFSLWGINTKVPFEGNIIGFYIVFLCSIVLTGIIAFVLYKKKLL